MLALEEVAFDLNVSRSAEARAELAELDGSRYLLEPIEQMHLALNQLALTLALAVQRSAAHYLDLRLMSWKARMGIPQRPNQPVHCLHLF